ncbi:MAG: hypothetical protein ACR2MX_01630 [Cyclobacteriaceae bacterium]
MPDKIAANMMMTGSAAIATAIATESVNIMLYRVIDNGTFYLTLSGAMSVIGCLGVILGIFWRISPRKGKKRHKKD